MKNEEIQAKIEAIKANKNIPDTLKPKMIEAWENKLTPEKGEKAVKSKMKKTKYRILSPDGFDIAMDKTFTNNEIPKAVKEFIKRYKKQGHYTDRNMNKIPLASLPNLIIITPAGEPAGNGVTFAELFPAKNSGEGKKAPIPSQKRTTTGKFEKNSEGNLYKGRKLSELDAKDCEELLEEIKKRAEAAARSSEKSKSKPVIEKAAKNVVQAVKHAIDNIPAAEIKDDPKGMIAKMKKAQELARKFLSDLRSLFGEDYDKDAVDDEMKELKAMIAELRKKYEN